MKNYSIVFFSESGHIETFGPFESVSDAKSWMTQIFNDNMEVAKWPNVKVKWNWNEGSYGNLGSCSIEGIGSWQIAELTK